MSGGATSGRARRGVVAALALALAALGVTVAVARATGDGSDGCDRARAAAAERRDLDTGEGRSVVVIGDSYSVGAGVDPLQSWPVRLPGRVHVDGFSGSGFSVGASPCGDVSYAARAARAVSGRPDAIVVVEGGLNDHDQSAAAIGDGFTELLRGLEGHDVLVVGPPPAPADRMRTEVPRVDATLSSLSASFGVPYLSMAEADLGYLPDGVHPTPAGHRSFGDRVADELVRLTTRG